MAKEQSWSKTITAAMTSYIDAGSIVAGAAGLSLWQQFLGMDGVQMGLLSGLSSNAASAAVGALIGGKLCDTFGRKFVYTYDLLVYICGMMLIVFGSSYFTLLTGYIIVGLGVGADVIASWTLIAEQAPAKDRARRCGSAQFAWALGPCVVLLISAWLNAQYGLLGNRIVFGHLMVIAFIVWLIRLRMPESEHWKETKEEEKRLIAEGKLEPMTYKRMLSNIVNLKSMVFLVMVYAVWNLAASTWGFFSPYLFETIGQLSNSESMLMQVGSFACSMLATFFIFMSLGDRISRRLIYFFAGALYVAAWSFWTLPPEMLAYPMIVMFAIFSGITNGTGPQAFYQLWCAELFPTKYRATAQGLTFFITRISCAIWLFLVPVIMESLGFAYAAALMVFFALVSCLTGTIWCPKTQGKDLKEIEIERYGKEVV